MKKTEKRRHIIQLIATIVTNGYLVGFMPVSYTHLTLPTIA